MKYLVRMIVLLGAIPAALIGLIWDPVHVYRNRQALWNEYVELWQTIFEA